MPFIIKKDDVFQVKINCEQTSNENLDHIKNAKIKKQLGQKRKYNQMNQQHYAINKEYSTPESKRFKYTSDL